MTREVCCSQEWTLLNCTFYLICFKYGVFYGSKNPWEFLTSIPTLSYAKSPPVDSWLHSKLTEISQRERLLSPFRNQSFFTIVILYANNLCSKLATHYAEIGLFMTLEKWRTLSPPESSSSANASCRVPFAWSPHANFKIDISQP